MAIILFHLQIKSFTLFLLPSAPPALVQNLSEQSNQMDLAEQQRALASQGLLICEHEKEIWILPCR